MAVGHEFMWQKSVQQGFDGRISGAAIEQAGTLGTTHFRLGEAVQTAQAAQSVEIQHRQIGRLHNRHIGAARLDAEYITLATRCIPGTRLDRAVAPAMKNQPASRDPTDGSGIDTPQRPS